MSTWPKNQRYGACPGPPPPSHTHPTPLPRYGGRVLASSRPWLLRSCEASGRKLDRKQPYAHCNPCAQPPCQLHNPQHTTCAHNYPADASLSLLTRTKQRLSSPPRTTGTHQKLQASSKGSRLGDGVSQTFQHVSQPQPRTKQTNSHRMRARSPRAQPAA